jgi:hypothetical protein
LNYFEKCHGQSPWVSTLLGSVPFIIGHGPLTFSTYPGLGSTDIALFNDVRTCFRATMSVISSIIGWVKRQKDLKRQFLLFEEFLIVKVRIN